MIMIMGYKGLFLGTAVFLATVVEVLSLEPA